MSEKEIAKRIGAKLISNSGRGLTKGDMEKDIGPLHFLIDAKEGKSFALSIEVWRKVCNDAMTHGVDTIPLILREFPNGVRLAMIAWDDLEALLSDKYG